MPACGTPQGSVISPLLFNIALLHLPVELDHIPDLHHAFYADDITLWTTQGSDGAQQDTLQQAINTINTYLIPRGLRCQAEKSAVLMLRSRTRGRPPEPPMNPNLKIQNTSIPQVPTLRILGVPFHHDGSGAALIPQLNKTCAQLTHLIKRVSHQHAGLRENESCKLIQALLLSRITYGTPYVALKPAELRKLDILVRKAYKTALHLPTFTPTKKNSSNWVLTILFRSFLKHNARPKSIAFNLLQQDDTCSVFWDMTPQELRIRPIRSPFLCVNVFTSLLSRGTGTQVITGAEE